MPKFPKEIYVSWDKPENGDPCILAWESPRPMEHGEKVAIYTLKDVRTKVVTHTLK